MKKFLTFVLAALASVATFAGTLSCAEAVDIAKGLEPNTPSEDEYIVEGYVVSVIKSSATDLCFWMADDAAAEEGTFEAWMCTGDIVNKGDKVTVTGYIQWYVDQKNPEDQKAEIAGGTVVVVEPAPAKTSTITYTATEKLPETTETGRVMGLHLNAFYAADSTQLTVTHTFDEAKGVGTITLDGEVAIIGDKAFYQCASLASVTLPASLTTIGKQAFYITGLTSVTIPAGVTEIGESVFYQCDSLLSVTLSEGLTTIGMGAFFNCYVLQSITIPASVTTIGSSAFATCFALASVTFLGNACQEGIGDGAFMSVGDPNPALLTLPDNWTGSKPDEDGNWYGGKFELSEDPTALPILFGDDVKGNKFLHNGQLIIRKGDKTYTTLGQEVR